MITITRRLEFDAGHRVMNGNWKPLVVGKYIYFISDSGDVWGGRYRKFHKPYTDQDGYKITSIGGKQTKVHRLVAFCFLGKPPTKKHWLVRHKDGNPANNHVTNLAWGTDVENWEDRVKHNRHTVKPVKLNKQTVKEIREFSQNLKGRRYGYRPMLAKKYGVSIETITAVLGRRTWRHV